MHATTGLQTLMALHQEFESAAIQQTSARAAKALLKGEDSRALDDVLDSFETVAVLERRGAIDRELAWQTFSYWIDGYAAAAKSFIAEEQEATPTVWEEIEGLRARFAAFERSKGQVSDAPTDVKAFVRYEGALRGRVVAEAPSAAAGAPSPPPARPDRRTNQPRCGR
jgi:hypothetical protein